MSKNKAVRLALVFLALTLISLTTYLLYFDNFGAKVVNNTIPQWLNKLIALIYPRFAEERSRFDTGFINAFVWQVFVRLSFVFFTAFVVFGLYGLLPRVRKFISAYWHEKTSKSNLWVLSFIFYGFCAMIFYTGIVPGLMEKLGETAFFKPVTFYKWLHIPFPGLGGIYVYAVLFGLLLMGLFTRFKPIFSALAGFLFIYLTGFFHCFEKVDHGFALMSYIMLLMPFLFLVERGSPGFPLIDAWPLKLIQLVIALAYFLAGMEKLMYSRFDFIDPESFRIILSYHDMPAGRWLAHNGGALLYILPVFTLLVQLSFPLILILPRYKWLFLFGVLGFHLAVAIFLGLYGFVFLWGISYIFFFNWEKLAKKASGLFPVAQK